MVSCAVVGAEALDPGGAAAGAAPEAKNPITQNVQPLSLESAACLPGLNKIVTSPCGKGGKGRSSSGFRSVAADVGASVFYGDS